MHDGAINGLDDRQCGDFGGLRFDYETVSSSVAKFLRGQADRIRRQSATSIIQIGKALIEAKRHLSHGGFLRWVECEVGIPARTAQAYMRVASWASDKGAIVAHLSPSALHLLSAASVPEGFVTDIIRRTEAGERIAPNVLREELRAYGGRRCLVEAENLASSTRLTSPSDLMREAENEALSAVAELVTILAQSLSASDFARVREIATSDTVLSDPQLPMTLERAFNSIAYEYLAPA